MIDFIKLTNYDDQITYVNFKNVTTIIPYREGSKFFFVNGNHGEAKETPEQIYKLIEDRFLCDCDKGLE